MQNRGTLLVISGPSGTGKGTLCKALLDRCSDTQFSVSATTRAPRPGEVDGVHYDFVTPQQFDEMIAQDAFVEYAEVFGMNRYGTQKKRVQSLLDHGMNVLLDIDVQGAQNVRRKMPEAVLIFIAPPSFAVLEQRLRNRGTETDEQIQRRLETAKGEMAVADQYDYIVVNDELDIALEQLIAIKTAESCKTARCIERVQQTWRDVQ